MKNYKSLLYFISNYNDYLLIAIMMVKPEEIILGVDKNSIRYEMETTNNLVKSLEKTLDSTKISLVQYDGNNLETVEELFTNLDKETCGLCLSNNSFLPMYVAYRKALISGFDFIVPDVTNRKLAVLNLEGAHEVEVDFAEPRILDILNCSGAGIVSESTKLYQREDIKKLTEIIATHHEYWKSFKTVMYESGYKDDTVPNKHFNINYSNIHGIKKDRFEKFINILAYYGFITNLTKNEFFISFLFKDDEIKNFILKYGTWLEAPTYYCVNSIKEVDDVKGGLVFLWDANSPETKNEFDVVAAVDSRLVCISCKDTNNIDSEDLNEIFVYANKIGGEDSTKLLILAEEPRKHAIIKRANELKIQIILFEGDIINLKNEINRWL